MSKTIYVPEGTWEFHIPIVKEITDEDYGNLCSPTHEIEIVKLHELHDGWVCGYGKRTDTWVVWK